MNQLRLQMREYTSQKLENYFFGEIPFPMDDRIKHHQYYK